jgi:hypothetical protein
MSDEQIEAARRAREHLLATVSWIEADSMSVGGVIPIRVWNGDRWLIPAFQFDKQGNALPHLAELIALLPERAHGWTRLFWLYQPHARLAGRIPAETFASDPVAVIDAARSSFQPGDTNW